jgi:SAM-dependent methyltransferase
MREFWEERFKKEDYVYGVEPNIFFKDFIDGLQPGRILLPAEGEGRNAVYAANKGWEVDAFDFSLNARRKALELARKEGVSIEYLVADIEFHELEDEMYDAIALIHVHFHSRNRTYIHKKLINSLKTGGFFLIEAFSKEQFGNVSGGPKEKDLLYDISDLRHDFGNINIETLYEKKVELDEGIFHKGPADVIRMVAIK